MNSPMKWEYTHYLQMIGWVIIHRFEMMREELAWDWFGWCENGMQVRGWNR